MTIKVNEDKERAVLTPESPRPAQVDVEALRLPWRVHISGVSSSATSAVLDCDNMPVLMFGETARSRMEYLVTAVNSHASLIAERDALADALIKARSVIRTWHGMGMPAEMENAAWAMYDASAPEMKAINAALLGTER